MIRIEKGDWDRVHELACEVVNASSMGDPILVAVKTEGLMSLLAELATKCGPCSRISATVADFTDDEKARPRLYREALRLAKAEGDIENERLILESLAEVADDEKREP